MAQLDMPTPPWLPIATAEAGVRTLAPGLSHPRVALYHRCTTTPWYDDKASWCSSFANWVFAQVGIAGTGQALARSWLAWGEPLSEPRPGCIAVLWRESPESWKGHVGFYLRTVDDRVYLYGGNQLDSVCENSYPVECVLGYRWPNEALKAGPQHQASP
jgi:uncharacterized protein (TIGR02594 family)